MADLARSSAQLAARKLRSRSLPAVGQDALGVELHALERVLAVAQAHHHAVLGPGRDLEALRHASRARPPASGSAWP